MGVTIESKNHYIDLGYGGFMCLRTKVAELAAPDIFEHYKKSIDGMRLYDENERKAFYKSYNAKIAELDRKYNGRMSDILDFLYKSDCSAEMDVSHCRSIYEVIKDYDDDISYGFTSMQTVQNSLISKKSSRMVLTPAMDSAGVKNCKKKTKKMILTPDGGKGRNYEDFSDCKIRRACCSGNQ